MTSIAARFLDMLDPTAASKAAAVTGQQEPTADQLAADSAARAETFGSGDADGPDLEPVYEPERPVIADELAELVRVVRSTLLGSPPPDRLTVYRINSPAATAGIATQLVPPSEGRKRRILIECLTGTVYLSGERRDTGSATTGDVTGFALDDGTNFQGEEKIELFTTGAVYVTSTAAYDLRVLIEHYPEG